MKYRMELSNDADLKKSVIDKGYTMTGFAKKLGITRSYLYRIVNRKINPSVKLATKIERKLNADHHSIFLVVDVQKSEQKQSTA